MTAVPLPETPVAITTNTKKRLRLAPIQLLGVAMLITVIVFVAGYPLLPGYDAYAQELSRAQLPPLRDTQHLLGTDALGRDVLSRLALGGRITVAIAMLVVILNVLIGTTLGMLAGFYGRWFDTIISVVADIQLAMPVVLLLIALAAIFGPSVTLMVLVLGCTYWVGYARVARAISMQLRDRDFVFSPMIQGAAPLWIIRKHVLPHLSAQMIIIAVTDIGVIMLSQAALDYLGLGVQPPTPSWGGMIFDGQKLLRVAPWLAIVPGIAMFAVVAGTQFLSTRFTTEGTIPLRKRSRS